MLDAPATVRDAPRRSVVQFVADRGAAGPLAPPRWFSTWLAESDVRVVEDVGDLVLVLRRSRPDAVVIDAGPGAVEACQRCKADAYTALIPCVVVGADARAGVATTAALLSAGADEVLRAAVRADEALARLHAALRRGSRDRSAQPTTGLPGPPAIDAVLAERVRAGVDFAACYADLDHFKEYNDRYGFREGDRVIRLVARLLYDVALGAAGPDAFVGHIGGDDFLCVLPLAGAADACGVMVETFDTLAPLQYNAADRRAGYYLGKDRRGQLHRVPLMTLSIGVASTERRRFESAAEVGRVASEMKAFAKTLPGSVFAFDRRGEEAPAVTPSRSL